MLLDDTVAEGLIEQQIIRPFRQELLEIHNKALKYANKYEGALCGPWPVKQWFPKDLVESSVNNRYFFDDLYPTAVTARYFRGFAVLEHDTDFGFLVFQPFMPPHEDQASPDVCALLTPDEDWLRSRLQILVSKIAHEVDNLKFNSRVTHPKDRYNGNRKNK